MNALVLKLKQLKKDDYIKYADMVCAFLLVLCPILQYYVGLVVDARATVMLILTPYLLFKIWVKNEIKLLLITPFMSYCVYRVFADGFTLHSLCREGMACFILIAVACGVIDLKSFIKLMTIIAVIASCLIFVQYFCYYILGFHLQLVPTTLFTTSSEQWIGMAETGRISILGNKMPMYRPSSFFLEPSHMALFCTPSILLTLLAPGFTLRRGILAGVVTLGVIASTSGIGIALCAGIWLLFFAFYFGEEYGEKPLVISKFKMKGIRLKEFDFKGIPVGKFKLFKFHFKGYYIRPINIIFVIILLVVFVISYFFVDVVRDSVNRIFASGKRYNALSGRLSSGFKAIKELNGFEIIIGKSFFDLGKTGYTAAFFKTFYKYGLIGLTTSYFFYIYSAIKLKRQYFWLAIMILGLSLFTVHTHMLSYMMFFSFILFAGHFESGTDNPKQLALSIRPFGLKNKIDTKK